MYICLRGCVKKGFIPGEGFVHAPVHRQVFPPLITCYKLTTIMVSLDTLRVHLFVDIPFFQLIIILQVVFLQMIKSL